MASRLSYHEQLNREFRKAAKRNDQAAMQYYTEATRLSACVSFERFMASWAGQNWMQRFDARQAATVAERRFRRDGFATVIEMKPVRLSGCCRNSLPLLPAERAITIRHTGA